MSTRYYVQPIRPEYEDESYEPEYVAHEDADFLTVACLQQLYDEARAAGKITQEDIEECEDMPIFLDCLEQHGYLILRRTSAEESCVYIENM